MTTPVVLFDFDGTLADTIALIVESYRHTLAASGLATVPDADLRSWIGRPLLPVFEERYPGRGDELTQTYRDWNLANHDRLIRAVDGMPDLLRDLAGAGRQLGVVSSKRSDTVALGLRAVGLEGLIDVLAGMDDTAEHKPSPAPLLYAADRLGAAPAACTYVGDATVDVLAAHAAGMRSIAVTWGAGERDALAEAGADAVVDDVTGLRAALDVG